jgi:hypothetical protein
MAIAKYVYRKSDNRFVGGGFYDAQPPMVAGPKDADGNPTQVPDYVNFGVAEFGDADLPDLAKDLYDPAIGGKRPMTPAEINAFVKRPTMQLTKLQAKLALKAIGKLGAVKAYVASLPNDHDAALAWQDAQMFKRESGLLVSAAQALGFTDDQIDALFITGASIDV